MGTGSKCIGHNKIRHDGGMLHDSHAEVIARRAFQRFVVVCVICISCFPLQQPLPKFSPGTSMARLKPSLKM